MEKENVDANIVQARHFQLVDEDGRIRAQLFSGPEDVTALELYQGGETPRISLGINANGTARMDLRDDTGEIRARLAVEPPGTPTVFTIRDAPNRIRAQILLQGDGAVGITLTNNVGEPRAVIEVHPDEMAFVGLYDRDGNPVSGLANEPSQ